MAKAYERILSSHASSFASTAHTPPRNSITFIALRLGIKMLLTLGILRPRPLGAMRERQEHLGHARPTNLLRAQLAVRRPLIR